MRIDLHTQSTASDGTSTPQELVRDAAAAGLDVVALTDHDTTAGWDAAAAALPAGLTLVPGAELSCRWTGTDTSIGLHVLAYLFDPDEPAFAAERARVRQARLSRAERIVARLRADGVDVGWPDVQAVAAGGTVGRPHVARVLVARGYAADMTEAFAPHWLGQRYRLAQADTDVFTALRLVRGAGGVAVLAHAKAARRGPVVPDGLLAELAATGDLAGLEADHADHDRGERAALRGLATDLGLLVTGSSDYHGFHKDIRLGDNATTDAGTYERLLALASGRAPVTA